MVHILMMTFFNLFSFPCAWWDWDCHPSPVSVPFNVTTPFDSSLKRDNLVYHTPIWWFFTVHMLPTYYFITFRTAWTAILHKHGIRLTHFHSNPTLFLHNPPASSWLEISQLNLVPHLHHYFSLRISNLISVLLDTLQIDTCSFLPK